MSNNEVIRNLESYKYDYQYFVEKSKDIESLKKEIQRSYERLNDLKLKNRDTSVLKLQIESIIEKQAQEEKTLLKIIKQKQEIVGSIDSLVQPYKNIFFLKYIGMLTFDEIAKKMNYSTKRIYQLHKEGVEIFCKLYNKK